MEIESRWDYSAEGWRAKQVSLSKDAWVTQLVCSSLLRLQQEQLPHNPSLRQRGEELAHGEERKYSQNRKCVGVGACRSTTFQSRITVSPVWASSVAKQTLQGDLSRRSRETWAGCPSGLVRGHKGQSVARGLMDDGGFSLETAAKNVAY